MPARLRDIKRVLESFGGAIDDPSSGSHFHATRGGKLCPVPAHNGLKTEISDIYIKKLCRVLGIDYDEFVKNL